MFIHGKLFLTAHNIMLDEVRSLLQKSLRRKEWVLALQSSKELLGYEKDQLPWKSIVTYLFEDHCLSDTDVLMSIYKATLEKSKSAKYTCIELLMQCKTCRIAACLPVIALDSPYEPKRWDSSMVVDEEIQGLVVNTKGLMNTDVLLAHLLDAWKTGNHELIITYMKMATMVVDHEKRQLTEKGKQYLISSQVIYRLYIEYLFRIFNKLFETCWFCENWILISYFYRIHILLTLMDDLVKSI